jgi:hypothetical protein
VKPRCSVCRHKERRTIDLGLARGVSVSALAQHYGLSTDALYRHVNANHTPARDKAALIAGPDMQGLSVEQLREREGQSLLAHLIALRNRLFSALDLGERFGDVNMVTRASAQLHENLALTGRLVGQLATGNTTNITNVLVDPSYIGFRSRLLKALTPFPEARLAVAEVLNATEHDAPQPKLIEHNEHENELEPCAQE